MRRSVAWLAPLAVGALLAVSACVPSEAEGDELVSNELQITELRVPGPAAERPVVGEINRVGSASVPVRAYEPARGVEPWATLVWSHGGSFVRGTLDWPEADWVSRGFAAAGLRVLSVDYVLASETVKAPALSNDVAAVLAWAGAEYPGPLVAGGASAGAQLTVLAAVDQRRRTPARPAEALLLEYPTLHRVQRADPQLADAVAALPEARRFRADRIAEMYDFYLGAGSAGAGSAGSGAGSAGSGAGSAGADSAGAGSAGSGADSSEPPPAVAGELPPETLALLPPTIIVNADADELRASGEEFAEQLAAAGVRVTATTEPGTVHGYLNRPEESAAARAQAAATIEHFVRELRGLLGA
ncbi:alpha/beta hydrolase [Leucobacter albus]|uniref:Alpha/beta hydrolase n=1 Tax=Leucobacter albus TaxID=272210 RepID=A0ABW3TLW5_9MICO